MSAATKQIPVWLRSCSRCRSNGTPTKTLPSGVLVCMNARNCRRRQRRREMLRRRAL